MTPEGIYCPAAHLLQAPLPWADDGRQGTVKTLLRVLFDAAGQVGSLAITCQRLRTAPSDQAVRAARRALGPPPETLDQQRKSSFAAQLPKTLRQRRQRLAIARSLMPYDGPPHRRVEELSRGQAQSGTTHFPA